ncbi:hypothetical protein [Archangium violaceum]|uniref:hypothetical protein n=1 Tax=Archangium violaceum TaxID=83451 RepID=UPI0013624E25|nr:hypothetical protein [Archangium violaceum]
MAPSAARTIWRHGVEEQYDAHVNPMLVLDGGTLLFPRGQGAQRLEAFASVGLGMSHAR